MRPAIVRQDSAYAGKLPLVLVVPLTSQHGSLRFPGTVSIKPSKKNGLSSVALVFQIRVLDRDRLIKHLGSVVSADLESIFIKLDRLTGRNPIEGKTNDQS